MDCPVCKDTQLVMAERLNIEIDYCPKCRGVWLDRGELDKIIERSVEDTTTCSTRFPHGSHTYDCHDHEKREHDNGRKRFSIWREIFD